MDSKLRFLTKERLVFGATALFFMGLIVFVAGVRADPLKVALILVGVLLAALIPEVLSEAPQRRRLLLMSVPIAGVAIVQILDSAAGATQLSNQISAVQLSAIHDRIRRCEEIAQEQVTPDPRDALQSLSTADQAMEFRANIVAMRVEIYQARVSSSRLAASTRARQTLEDLRREEAHYRAAATFIAHFLRPRYSVLREGREINMPRAQLMIQLEGAAQDLAAFADRTPSAGIFTRLGLLAIARGQRDQALYYYYRGLMIDPDFLANYDSLGHAGWVLNQDSRVGLRYAQAGAALVERLRPLPVREVEETASALGPAEARALRAHWRAFEPTWTGYLDSYRDRFALQEAYFSALELENEDTARESAERLLRSDPDDAEYQDAMGFVLLRFARNIEELQRAANLFRQAATNTDAEHATERTAEKHTELAEELMHQTRSGGATGGQPRSCA